MAQVLFGRRSYGSCRASWTEKSAARAAAFESEPALEEHYKPIPTYEGIHRYDPKFNWSHIEEKKLVRRVGPIMTCYYGSF